MTTRRITAEIGLERNIRNKSMETVSFETLYGNPLLSSLALLAHQRGGFVRAIVLTRMSSGPGPDISNEISCISITHIVTYSPYDDFMPAITSIGGIASSSSDPTMTGQRRTSIGRKEEIATPIIAWRSASSFLDVDTLTTHPCIGEVDHDLAVAIENILQLEETGFYRGVAIIAIASGAGFQVVNISRHWKSYFSPTRIDYRRVVPLIEASPKRGVLLRILCWLATTEGRTIIVVPLLRDSELRRKTGGVYLIGTVRREGGWAKPGVDNHQQVYKIGLTEDISLRGNGNSNGSSAVVPVISPRGEVGTTNTRTTPPRPPIRTLQLSLRACRIRGETSPNDTEVTISRDWPIEPRELRGTGVELEEKLQLEKVGFYCGKAALVIDQDCSITIMHHYLEPWQVLLTGMMIGWNVTKM